MCVCMKYSHDRRHVDKREAYRSGHLENPVLLVRDSSRNYPTHDGKDVPVECRVKLLRLIILSGSVPLPCTLVLTDLKHTLASSLEMRWTVNLPFTPYTRRKFSPVISIAIASEIDAQESVEKLQLEFQTKCNHGLSVYALISTTN